LKRRGVLLAVGISRFASTIDGISRGLVRDPRFVKIMRQDLETSRHVNDTGEPEYFTTAYFHLPSDLRRELEKAGFDVTALIGIEGPVWMIPDLGSYRDNPEDLKLLLETLRTIEEEPSLIGASAHIMAVGRKA
jgi:hypothetical protein